MRDPNPFPPPPLPLPSSAYQGVRVRGILEFHRSKKFSDLVYKRASVDMDMEVNVDIDSDMDMDIARHVPKKVAD
jgi:hypothetical protein